MGLQGVARFLCSTYRLYAGSLQFDLDSPAAVERKGAEPSRMIEAKHGAAVAREVTTKFENAYSPRFGRGAVRAGLLVNPSVKVLKLANWDESIFDEETARQSKKGGAGAP